MVIIPAIFQRDLWIDSKRIKLKSHLAPVLESLDQSLGLASATFIHSTEVI